MRVMSRTPFTLRLSCADDLDAIARVFTESVHTLTGAHYDARQREAWAPRSIDRLEWQHRLTKMTFLLALAVDTGEIAGFLGYTPGYVELLYTAPWSVRRGVASTLYAHVEHAWRHAGVASVSTEASLVARPFFERQGLRVIEEQQVERRGVLFRRFAMSKSL